MYNFFSPARVLFGCGVLNQLHTLKMPGKKALLVISNGRSARANGYLDRTEAELKAAGVEVVLYEGIGANPLKEAVEEGAFLGRKEQVDVVVALGGGSVLDAGKVMAMFIPQESDDLWDYAGGLTGKQKTPEKKALPWIAITTSAGTGSEVDATGVVTNLGTDEKIALGGGEDVFATYAIVDPELTVSVPAKYTAFQGFDALFHSLEGYLSNRHNLMSDMVQRSAIEHISANLAAAVKDGSNLAAREAVSYGNTMSGYSMVLAGCISEHAMEHAMSAYYPKLQHGAGLIMISKEYFTYWINRHVADKRFVEMARFMGIKDAVKPEDFITALVKLQEDCGVADLRMSDYGIKFEDCRKFAENARATTMRLIKNDPAETTNDDFTGIYERSYK